MRPVREEWKGGGRETERNKSPACSNKGESASCTLAAGVLCTPYSPCISLPFSSFSRPFARPLYDFIFLLPMLHTTKVTSGRMSCCQVYKAYVHSLSRFLSFLLLLSVLLSFSFSFFLLELTSLGCAIGRSLR